MSDKLTDVVDKPSENEETHQSEPEDSFEEETETESEEEEERTKPRIVQNITTTKDKDEENTDSDEEELEQEVFMPLTQKQIEAAKVAREAYVEKPYSVRMEEARARREHVVVDKERIRSTNPYSENQRTVFVGNIPRSVQKHEIAKHFSMKFGHIDYVKIPQQTTRLVYAFVIFVHPTSATAAVDAEYESFDNITLKIEVPKTSVLRKTSSLFGAGGDSSRWAADLRDSIEYARQERQQEEAWQ